MDKIVPSHAEELAEQRSTGLYVTSLEKSDLLSRHGSQKSEHH